MFASLSRMKAITTKVLFCMGLLPYDIPKFVWFSRQSFWLQVYKSRFHSRHYQIFCEVVSLERGPLGLVSTIEELIERRSSGSALENREYDCRDPSRRPRDTLYPQMLALTSLTSGGRSVDIVLSQTKASEFFSCFSFVFHGLSKGAISVETVQRLKVGVVAEWNRPLDKWLCGIPTSKTVNTYVTYCCIRPWQMTRDFSSERERAQHVQNRNCVTVKNRTILDGAWHQDLVSVVTWLELSLHAWVINWKGLWRKMSWLKWHNISTFNSRDWGKR
jgi:hypothetical protein